MVMSAAVESLRHRVWGDGRLREERRGMEMGRMAQKKKAFGI